MIDRMAICDAYYLFACGWHRGMGSAEYRIFGRLSRRGYRPSPLLTNETLSEQGRTILAGLIRRARKGKTVGR